MPASRFTAVTSTKFIMISHLLPFTEPEPTINIMSWVGWIHHLPWQDSVTVDFPSLFLGTKSHPRLGAHHRGRGWWPGVRDVDMMGPWGSTGLLAIPEGSHTSSLLPSYLREWGLMGEHLLICFTSPQFTVQPQLFPETAMGFFHPPLFHLTKIPGFFPSHRSNLFTLEPSLLRQQWLACLSHSPVYNQRDFFCTISHLVISHFPLPFSHFKAQLWRFRWRAFFFTSILLPFCIFLPVPFHCDHMFILFFLFFFPWGKTLNYCLSASPWILSSNYWTMSNPPNRNHTSERHWEHSNCRETFDQRSHYQAAESPATMAQEIHFH